METAQDAYGKQLLEQYYSQRPTAEFIERDDFCLMTGSEAGAYFFPYEEWPAIERRAIDLTCGRVLDIGCGAGRHSLYLQQKGLKVTAIDNSPGAVEVCRLRGVETALVKPISDVDNFEPASFDTILMFGNNFGLFGDAERARRILTKFSRITAPGAKLIAGTLNPYQTENPDHLEYHEFNRRRGRMPGQIKMRVRYGKIVGDWFDYLFVSPEEMQDIFAPTEWQIEELIEPGGPNYFAVAGKKIE